MKYVFQKVNNLNLAPFSRKCSKCWIMSFPVCHCKWVIHFQGKQYWHTHSRSGMRDRRLEKESITTPFTTILDYIRSRNKNSFQPYWSTISYISIIYFRFFGFAKQQLIRCNEMSCIIESCLMMSLKMIRMVRLLKAVSQI